MTGKPLHPPYADRPEGTITIRFGVTASPVPNTPGCYAPVLEVNGRRRVEWCARDKPTALRAARLLAADEARRYVGDWTITTEPMP